MKLLLFAGAGTSIELGVPAMTGLAREFLAHVKQWDIEPVLVHQIMGDRLDVETFIEEIDLVCEARGPLERLGHVEADFFAAFQAVRSEVEWFVQHAAERVSPRSATLLWGSTLQASGRHDVTFVTTNYDRAIELAAHAEDVRLVDGFQELRTRETAPWGGFIKGSSDPLLVKMHGSTDWYAEQETGDPVKLRHPMPLFGKAELTLPNGSSLGSALVLPSREKLLNRAPYPLLAQAFLNAKDECDGAVFVGTSLRDVHVRDAAKAIAVDRPVLVVNPEGDAFGIPGAVGVAEYASQFLISTLPKVLLQDDPLAALQRLRTKETEEKAEGVLEYLEIAMDTLESRERRCFAIEVLDQRLRWAPESIVSQLLGDEDATVARYALGLVVSAHDRQPLLQRARECAHAEDTEFAEEVVLLERILAQT